MTICYTRRRFETKLNNFIMILFSDGKSNTYVSEELCLVDLKSEDKLFMNNLEDFGGIGDYALSFHAEKALVRNVFPIEMYQM